jgi:hypothetical protein
MYIKILFDNHMYIKIMHVLAVDLFFHSKIKLVF